LQTQREGDVDRSESGAAVGAPVSGRCRAAGIIAGFAGRVAYENSKLYRDVENLLEGFVNAAVKAIEQRDPTTSAIRSASAT